MSSRNQLLTLLALSAAACSTTMAETDGGPGEAADAERTDAPVADAGAGLTCRMALLEIHSPPGGPVVSRATWSWAADGESFVVEMDSELDGAIDVRQTLRRIDATHHEHTIDDGADGSIEWMDVATTNAAGQIVARDTTEAGVLTRCTMRYDSDDTSTPAGVYAAHTECVRGDGEAPSSVSACTFDHGRLVRCDHDARMATFPQGGERMADGIPDSVESYTQDGNTATVRSDIGAFTCSAGVCTATTPDGAPEHVMELTFDAGGHPELFFHGRPIAERYDDDGDGTWDWRRETEYGSDGRRTVSRGDLDNDGTWDEERLPTYECL